MAFSPPSLLELRRQADALYPGRSTASDGWLGDAAHRARKSDHNPDASGCVHARDLTTDASRGFDAHRWARQVAERGDERVAYLISAGEIWNPTASAWQTYTRLRAEGHSRTDAARMALPGWRTYTGSNPHRTHVHVSIKHTDAARNDTSPWFTTGVTKEDIARMFETHRFVEPNPPQLDADGDLVVYSWDPANSAVFAWNGAPGPVPTASGQEAIRRAGGIRHLAHVTGVGLVALMGDPQPGNRWPTWQFRHMAPQDRSE